MSVRVTKSESEIVRESESELGSQLLSDIQTFL